MSPMQFTASTKTTLSQDTNTPSELSQLNKQQFKDAFINLLQVCIIVNQDSVLLIVIHDFTIASYLRLVYEQMHE